MKSRDAGMSAGTARRVVLRGTAAAMMRQLADILSSLSQHEALIPAPPPAGKVEWKLVTKDELVKHPGAVARTKEFFIPTVGLGGLGLDLDMKTYPKDIVQRLITFEGKISGALAAVFPALAAAACVRRPSASVGHPK